MYIRSKVTKPCASRTYMLRAAQFKAYYLKGRHINQGCYLKGTNRNAMTIARPISASQRSPTPDCIHVINSINCVEKLNFSLRFVVLTAESSTTKSVNLTRFFH
jgi:hypothetical protein